MFRKMARVVVFSSKADGYRPIGIGTVVGTLPTRWQRHVRDQV